MDKKERLKQELEVLAGRFSRLKDSMTDIENELDILESKPPMSSIDYFLLNSLSEWEEFVYDREFKSVVEIYYKEDSTHPYFDDMRVFICVDESGIIFVCKLKVK